MNWVRRTGCRGGHITGFGDFGETLRNTVGRGRSLGRYRERKGDLEMQYEERETCLRILVTECVTNVWERLEE